MIDSEEEKNMLEFIEKYESMPELWCVKNDKYKNKNIKKRSYEMLLIDYKKIKSDATVDDLKRKIKNMRTCYRRELKKYVRSQRSGAGADDIYVPNLWYFEHLNFLKDLEMPLPGRSNFSSDEDGEIASASTKAKTENKCKKVCASDIRTQFLQKATEHLENSKNKDIQDDATIYANGWACMLRQMTPEQQLYAKQAIDEVLLLGRLNKLCLNFLNVGESSPAASSTPYYSELNSPYVVSVPLESPSASCNSIQLVPGNGYNSVHELFTDSQFQ